MAATGRLSFMVPEGSVQAFKGLRQATVILNYDTYEPYQQPAFHDNPVGAEVVHLFGR